MLDAGFIEKAARTQLNPVSPFVLRVFTPHSRTEQLEQRPLDEVTAGKCPKSGRVFRETQAPIGSSMRQSGAD